MDTGRPKTKQASRKGKKAWRKNIDLDDLEQGLEEKRESETVLGLNPLFEIDEAAHDEHLTKAMKSEKRLKSHEILYRRSAIPALKAPNKKQEKPKVKAKKIHEVLRTSGRTGESVSKVQIEHDGLVRGASADLWGDVAPVERKRKAAHDPVPAIENTPHVDLPHGGKSYNPSQEAWKNLIVTEHARLEKIEKAEQLAEQEKARIEALIEANAAKDDDEFSSSSEDEPEEENGEVRLSLNPPTKNKKKTRQQRAKQKRHQERERLHKQLRELRQQLSALSQAKEDISEGASDRPKNKKRKLLKNKHPLVETPLEVKLSDEIEDSLRRLRPEGDIAKERFRNLQARGLIEARVPQKVKRRYPRKVTEKWTYKDFNKDRIHGK